MPDVSVACQFCEVLVQRIVHILLHRTVQALAGGNAAVPCLAVDVLVIEAESHPTASPESKALVGTDTCEGVLRTEVIIAGGCRGCMSVVDLMASEVVVNADGTAGAGVVVLHSQFSYATVNPLAGIEQGGLQRSGIGRSEVGQVETAPGAPVLREVVAQFGKAAVLIETHVLAVVVAALVVQGYVAEELAAADAVVEVGLHASVGASSEIEVCVHTLCSPTGDDINDTSHSVGTIEQRGRSAHDFHALGCHRLIGIRNAMTEDSLVLGMAVDEDHHLPCAGT